MASIIFSAPRCSDLPDLLQVRNLFAAKYGKEFIAAASELRPDTSVNRTVIRLEFLEFIFSLCLPNLIWLHNLQIIEKLSVSAPPTDIKLNILKAIALEYNVNWDSTKTEQEFSKKPEDLLVSISFRLSINASHLWAFRPSSISCFKRIDFFSMVILPFSSTSFFYLDFSCLI